MNLKPSNIVLNPLFPEKKKVQTLKPLSSRLQSQRLLQALGGLGFMLVKGS